MVEQLFGSKKRVKLLRLFYSNPNRSFYVREITRKIDEQINSVRRELANLLNVGIITSDTSNNKVYYEVDQKYEFFLPLQEIFGEGGVKPKRSAKSPAKATSVVVETDEEKADLRALGNVDTACLLGQFTRDETSGIDLLIVGSVNQNAVQKYVTELEQQEGKELRYTIFSPDEFKYRLQIKDRFVSSVLLSKKQILVDKLGLLS
jgi:hypothetical protein